MDAAWHVVGLAVAVVFYGGICAYLLRKRLAAGLRRFRTLPRAVQVALALMIAIATVEAQKQGGTNAPPQMMSPRPLTHQTQLPTVTSNDIARGFLLEGVSTNDSYSYAMPTNGTRYAKWWLRGGYEDVFRLDLGGMRFPFGMNLCDSLWVYTWGMAGARLGDATNRIAATGVPMSAVPCASQFWSAALPGGARRLTWQDFALNRDTNTPVSAQLDLYPSGDFVARSNLVESVYRRINPDDWDDDGYPNDEDDNPYFWDGDNFGPYQELWEGANSNAYYFVDIMVSNANALVKFAGDGPSTLPDPQFIARPGETNRVVLLIGKTYTVTCQMPIDCIWVSDPEVEVHRAAENRLQIVWPVEIWSEDYGSYFEMFVLPDFLGGAFSWSTNGCCEITGSGAFYSFLCGGGCGCDGCSIDGHYRYEGYDITMFSGVCGCEPSNDEEDEPAGVGVSFSHKVLFYEDAYTNANGEVVEKHVSTNVTLSCLVYGGPYGGVASFSANGLHRLQQIGGDVIPEGNIDIQPEQQMTWTAIYKPEAESISADDVSVTLSFSEMLSGSHISDSNTLTVVKVEVAPEDVKTGYEHRHLVGVRELLRCKARPDLGAWSESGDGKFEDRRGDVWYRCPLLSGDCGLRYTFRDESYAVPLTVVEPSSVVARSPRALTYYVAEGEAGGVGMALSIYVLPETVSFSGIKIEEVPSNVGTHSGFFANPEFSEIWYHTEDQGAGNWYAIVENLKAEEDCPRFQGSVPRAMPDGTLTYSTQYDWCDGSLTWHIDWGWGDSTSELGDDPKRTIPHLSGYDQNFTITPDGTLTIDKLQNTVSRGTNDVFRKNGIVTTPSGN